MKKRIISLSEKESLLKEYNLSKQRVVITNKRLIIETSSEVYSIKLEAIGAVQIIKKFTGKTFLRVYGVSGESFFKYSNDFKIKILSSLEISEFEHELNEAILSLQESACI